MTTKKIQCSETVFGPRVHSWGCQRTGVVQRDGKWFCRQHDPEAKAARAKKSADKWAAKRKSDDVIDAEGKRIAKALGVDAHTFYHSRGPFSNHGNRRSLVIRFDDCLKLVEKLRNAKH